ncbi:MAG: hypothetical protein HFH88_15850 [Lachnospiraceae bacterium]|nr:hypothetical protein [Lachnospiraceae bacterium]
MRYRDIKPKRRGYVHAELFNEGEYMGWVISESIFSFLEMFISYFFASGIFRRKIKGSKTIYVMILFSVFGTALLTLREYAFAWIPDFVPAVFVFTLPIEEYVTGTRDFRAGLCLKTVVKGRYSMLSSVYAKQTKWAEQNGYECTGALFEVYVTDPSQVAEEDELITEVYYPIRKI